MSHAPILFPQFECKRTESDMAHILANQEIKNYGTRQTCKIKMKKSVSVFDYFNILHSQCKLGVTSQHILKGRGRGEFSVRRVSIMYTEPVRLKRTASKRGCLVTKDVTHECR